MDLKSLLRTFRYTELQAKADRDPNARRPPTIKFLAVLLVVGLLGLGFALLVMSFDAPASDGTTLNVSRSTATDNGTASSSSPAPVPAPQQQGPSPPRMAPAE